MRRYLLTAAVCLCSSFAITQSQDQAADNKLRRPPWPLQLEMRVPFEPPAFPSGPHVYLMYELHLTNFMPMPMSVSRIDVLDANARSAPPVATLEKEQLQTMWQPVGGKTLSDSKDGLPIGEGQSAIVFISIAFNRGTPIPDKIFHRVTTAYAPEEGAVASTYSTELRVLGPPVEGADWLAEDGPSNDQDNHHRRGVVILDGQPVDSRRFAIDWKQVKDGTPFSGDAKDVHSYYSYGKEVLAVADGRVVYARDGLPENVPGHGDAFHPAVPISLDTVSGNTVILDLGGGQFAYYMHLQPGSLRVKSEDRVRRGQVLARVGASGDAREPHLHFEVTTSSRLLAGEGLPYVIDRYTTKTKGDQPAELHTRELPLDKAVVTFGEERH